jgi:hypothetical protein
VWVKGLIAMEMSALALMHIPMFQLPALRDVLVAYAVMIHWYALIVSVLSALVVFHKHAVTQTINIVWLIWNVYLALALILLAAFQTQVALDKLVKLVILLLPIAMSDWFATNSLRCVKHRLPPVPIIFNAQLLNSALRLLLPLMLINTV